MFRHNKIAGFSYLLVDIILLLLLFFISSVIVPHAISFDMAVSKIQILILLLWGFGITVAFNTLRLYTTDRQVNILGEVARVFKGVLFISVLIAVAAFFFKIEFFPRKFFLVYVLLTCIALSFWRVIKRLYIRSLIKRGIWNYNVLLVGSSRSIQLFDAGLRDNTYFGLRAVGCLSDEKKEKIGDLPVLGSISEIDRVIKQFFIDEIFISLDIGLDTTRNIIAHSQKLFKTVRIAFDQPEFLLPQMSLSYLGVMPLVSCFTGQQNNINGPVKRLFDIIVSSLAIVFFSPLFVLIAALIKVESRGPIFYVSKRSGRKGKPFNFVKFCSMVVDADTIKKSLLHKSEVDGPIFKIKGDPRITKVGRLLRKYSLDELPQLFNVLKGDMSLVGPRPFPVEESNNIEYKHIPRLNIRPGITGLAQIKGRSDLKFSQWMRWDSWYAKNWSMGLDIRILLWTIPAVLKGKGAY